MLDPRIKRGLEACVESGRVQFLTYGEFGRKFGLGDAVRAWANRRVLDEAAAEFKNDSRYRLDLTYLLRNRDSGYPSVIDGQPFDQSDPGPQMLKAREAARKIIDRFGPGTRNPY